MPAVGWITQEKGGVTKEGWGRQLGGPDSPSRRQPPTK